MCFINISTRYWVPNSHTICSRFWIHWTFLAPLRPHYWYHTIIDFNASAYILHELFDAESCCLEALESALALRASIYIQRLPSRQHKDGCPGQFWLLPQSSQSAGPWASCRLSRPKDWGGSSGVRGRAMAMVTRIATVLMIFWKCISEQS
jgi:hypothetical protein